MNAVARMSTMMTILLATSSAAWAGGDKIAAAGERLTDGRYALCDGGVSYWQAVSEPGTSCSTSYEGFSTVTIAGDAISTVAELGACIAQLDEPQAFQSIPATDLFASNFYLGFSLWWDLAAENGQTAAVKDFAASDRILGRLFADLERRSDEVILFENTFFDGGQSEFLYVYDTSVGQLYQFRFGCG